MLHDGIHIELAKKGMYDKAKINTVLVILLPCFLTGFDHIILHIISLEAIEL